MDELEEVMRRDEKKYQRLGWVDEVVKSNVWTNFASMSVKSISESSKSKLEVDAIIL